jgi:hypothetical protein
MSHANQYPVASSQYPEKILSASGYWLPATGYFPGT